MSDFHQVGTGNVGRSTEVRFLKGHTEEVEPAKLDAWRSHENSGMMGWFEGWLKGWNVHEFLHLVLFISFFPNA